MYSDTKLTRSVADAVAKIINQPEAKTEQLQEGWDDMLKSVKDKQGPQPSGGSGVKQGTRYGGGRQKDEPEAEEKPKAKKKAKGAFSEMVNLYQEKGLKSLEEAWGKKKKVMKEEPDNEQFTKEVEENKKKGAGTAKQADVAKPAVQAVQQEETEQLDELKKSTLGSYVKKASKNLSDRSFDHGEDEHRQYGYGDDDEEDKRVDRDEKKIATRQQGINRAATKLAKEEVEQIDELSKTTLGNYYNAAKQDNRDHADSRRSGDAEESKWAKDRFVKRNTGMGAAKQRLNKEESETVEEELKGNQHKIDKNKNNKIDAHDFKLLRKEESEELDERTLTASETEKKEEIVKGMKKGMAGFKERYGDRAKSVMYATATKQAKGE